MEKKLKEYDYNLIKKQKTTRYYFDENLEKITGFVKIYWKDGTGGVRLYTEYIKGLKSGKQIRYYRNGNIVFEGKHKENIKVGTWNYYDYKGNLQSSETFKEKVKQALKV